LRLNCGRREKEKERGKERPRLSGRESKGSYAASVQKGGGEGRQDGKGLASVFS